MADILNFLKEYSDVLSLILVALVFPLLHNIQRNRKQEREHDEFIMNSIHKTSKQVEQLRRDMLDSQRRHQRMEDAILYLSDSKDVKKVIGILRGHDDAQPS